MRRWIALVAAVLVAPAQAATAPAAAQAAPVNPVKALERQLRPGHGIQITETDRAYLARDIVTVRRTDILLFDRSGIAAVDVVRRATSTLPPGRDGRRVHVERTIAVGGKNYRSGSSLTGGLPVGKTWIRDSRRAGKWDALFGDQFLNVLEPVTLGFMLRTSTHRLPDRGGVQYRGTITWAQLLKVSRSFREQRSFTPPGKAARSKIRWRLWLDAAGLPARLVTEDTFGGLVDNTVNDIRYTGWGSRVVVTAPPAGRVIDERDIDYTPEPPAPLSIVVEGAKTDGPADTGARLSSADTGARLSPGPDAGRGEVIPDEGDGGAPAPRPASTVGPETRR
ncbi:hypothetical protein [Streptomyces anulatus]|uniref:hypothetical protein n=1 Tax=Streptomyces anulatus TaxID=1892 RepID=UPI0034263D48